MMIAAQAELSQYLYSDPIPFQQLQFTDRDDCPLPPQTRGEDIGNTKTPSAAVMGPCPSGDRKNRAN